MKTNYKNGGIFSTKKQALKYVKLLSQSGEGTIYINEKKKYYSFVTWLTTTLFKWE